MKQCPNCEKKYRDYDQYCVICRYKLKYIEGTEVVDYCPEPHRLISKEAVEKAIDKAVLVKCPYCDSIHTAKIPTIRRIFSTSLLGLASGKVGKQWHCNKCGSDF